MTGREKSEEPHHRLFEICFACHIEGKIKLGDDSINAILDWYFDKCWSLSNEGGKQMKEGLEEIFSD